MNCNCQWTESILAIVILLFTYWSFSWSETIVYLAAIVLLIHAWMCKSCTMCREHTTAPVSGKNKKRK